jgi:pectinesterase
MRTRTARPARRGRALLLAIASVVTLVGLATPASAGAAAIKTKTNVQYTVDGKPQLLDVYSPSKAAPNSRAVIFIHGGGWTGGSRTEWTNDAKALAASGWVAFTIDYRVDSPTPYVREPADVAAAVSWVQRNARTYNVDPARIALVGASAGGHLAALAGMSGSGASGAPGRVKAVVSWSGPMDMAGMPSAYGCADMPCSFTTQWAAAKTQQFEGSCLQTACPDRWTSTSPIDQVAGAEPAVLLVNSTDEMIPLSQLTDMQEALSAAGSPVSTQVLTGSAHGQGYHDVAWPTTVSFLQAVV